MALPWLRLWHEFAVDPFVQTMSEALQRRLIMIFCFMQSGDLNKLTEEELAKAMGIAQRELIATKEIFIKKGFIENNWHPVNWKKRQTFDVHAAERMRNKRRNASVTGAEQKTNGSELSRASASASVSESPDGGAGGNPPDEVANLAAATEARWPAQNADTFVGDLCRTFDCRLVGQILNQAFDKDPAKLPRSWVRAGCTNEFNKGWTPPSPTANGVHKPGELPDELERKVREWEASQRSPEKS